MKFHDMNRKQLQALCKQHGIPANRTNREMADRLASTIKDEEKLKSPLEDRVVSSMEVEGENYSKILTKNVKKVRFSPENETFVFEKSENDSNSDEDFTPTKKQRKSKRKLNKAGLDKRSGKTTVVVKSSRIKKSISQVLELARNSSETLTSVDLGSDQTGGTAEQSSEISLNVGASDFAKPVRRSKRLAPGQDTTESLAESNVVPVATENGRNLKRKQEPESNEVTSITEFLPVPKNCTRRSTRLSSKDVLVVNEEQLSECSGKKQQKISNLQPTSEKSQVVESNLPQKASLSTESESGGHKITRKSSRIASNSDVDITEEQIDGKKQDITKLKPSHQQTQLSECTVALEKALNSECKPVAVKPTRRCTRKSTCIASEVDLVVTNRQTGKCFGKKQQNITKLQPTFEQTQLLEKTLASDKTLCVESEPIDTQPTKRFTRQFSKRDIVGTKEQTDSGFAKKQRRISKLPATIEQSQISESMLAPKETLSTEFELATKPSRTSTCPTSKSSLVVTDGQNGKVLRKRQVTKSKHEPLIEKPIRQSSRVASKEQKVGSQDRATEVVMPKLSSQLNEDLSTEQLDQGGVDFNLLGLEKGSEAESSPTSHVQNLEIYYLDEHMTENEKSLIILDQNSELLEDTHPDGVSSFQEIQDNNELENQQIAQSTALEKSSTNYSESESTIDASKASESIIGDESLQKSDIKNLGDEKTEDSNFEETLYGEPASPFVENKDNFDTEENIEVSSKFNKDSSSEHTVAKHEENGDEEDYICATPSKPQLVVNFYAGDNPADMNSPFEKDKDSSIGRSVDLPINYKGFDVSIERNISGVKEQVGDHRDLLCCLDSSLKKLYELKDHLSDSVSGNDQSADESFTPLTCQSNAKYEKSSGMSVRMKKLYEEEASPFKEVISDNSNGVDKFADKSLVRSVGKSNENYKRSNEMSVVIDSECAKQSGILTVEERTVEIEDHNEAKGCGTEIDHNYLKLGMETRNDAGRNETISDELMELTSLFQEEQCHHLNGSSAKSTAINLSELSAVEVNECKGVNVMHDSDFLSPSQQICCSESRSLADDNIVNSCKPIDFGNVDGFSPLKIGMGVCSDENLTYKEEDTVTENVGLSKHFKCQEDYEHQESAKEKVDQCKDANNEAVFMHGSGNKCHTLQDGEAMNCDSSVEVRPTCVLSLSKAEMAVDCSVDNTPMDIDACEHTDNAINGFSIESNVIDVLVSKEQVNDQKDSPCFRSALKKLLEQEFSPTKDVAGYSKMQGATSVEQPAHVIEEIHNGEINRAQLVIGEDSSSYIHSLNISYGILEESKIEREEFDATESEGKDIGDEYKLSCCVEVRNDGRGNERIEEDTEKMVVMVNFKKSGTGVFHKVNDRSVARASSEGESYPNDGKPLNKLDVESLNLAGTVEIEKVNVDAALTHEIEMFDSTVEIDLTYENLLYHEEQDTMGKTEDTFRYNDSLQHSRGFCMENDVIDLQEAVKVQPDGIEDVAHEDSSNICSASASKSLTPVTEEELGMNKLDDEVFAAAAICIASASKSLTPDTEEELGMNKLDDEVFAAAAICIASASKSLTPDTEEELGMNKLDDEVFAAAASNTHEVGLVKNSNAEAVSSSVSKEKEDFYYVVKSHLFTSREMSLFLGDGEQIEGLNTNAVPQESSMKDKVIHETGDVLKEQDGINSENGSLHVSVDKIILAENADGSDNDPPLFTRGCDSKDFGKDSISRSNIDDFEFMVKSKNVEDDSEASLLSNDQIATGGIVSANIDELESTVEKKVSEPVKETVEFSYDQKEPDTRMVHHSSAVNFAIEKEVAVEEPLRPFVQNKTPEAKKSKAIMFSKQFSSSTMKLETNKTNLVQGTDMKENAAISKSEQLGYVTAPRANRRPLEELRKS
ncbi:hypothetical protein ACFE04_012661 [Oxalis oulophora]